MKAVLLCGGAGTRIRDVADDIPKPLIRIGEHPVLWHIMKLYAHYGIQDFVLCLGYKGWLIKEYFLNYRLLTTDITVDLGNPQSITLHGAPREEWKVTLAETGEATETGGRIRAVKKYLEDDGVFCLTYGDGVADIHIDSLIRFHKAHGRIGTVTGVRPPGRFGVMQTDLEDEVPLVRTFEEKAQASQGVINGGFFVFDDRVWSYLNEDPALIFEHQPLSRLAQDGQLVLYEHTGFWQPMDTFREWRLLNRLWTSESAPWKVWE